MNTTTAVLRPGLSPEVIVAQSSPAVLFLQGADGARILLKRFYPEVVTNTTTITAKPESVGRSKVTITSDLENAEIYIDDKFVGNTPATITLSTGGHKIEVKGQNGETWQRDLGVLDDSEVTVKAILKKQPAN